MTISFSVYSLKLPYLNLNYLSYLESASNQESLRNNFRVNFNRSDPDSVFLSVGSGSAFTPDRIGPGSGTMVLCTVLVEATRVI